MATLVSVKYILRILLINCFLVIITTKNFAQDSSQTAKTEGLSVNPKSLEDCYLPEAMVDRIYRSQPKEMAKLREDFQQNVRVEGEEVVLRVKLMFKANYIVGFYQLIPVRTMDIEHSERVYFEFPVEFCCEDTAKIKFCTQSIDEALEMDKLQPKHSEWKQKVNGKIWRLEEEQAAARALLEAQNKKKKKSNKVATDSSHAQFGAAPPTNSKKKGKKSRFSFTPDTSIANIDTGYFATDSNNIANKKIAPIPTLAKASDSLQHTTPKDSLSHKKWTAPLKEPKKKKQDKHKRENNFFEPEPTDSIAPIKRDTLPPPPNKPN